MESQNLYFSQKNQQRIFNFYDEESKNCKVFPPKKDIFRAFDLCPLNQLKVVIIGQDPYSRVGQANGLAFSVNKGITLPPSLRNIYTEIENEYGQIANKDGDLTYLAKQGVLLLNSILTVKEGMPLSHDNQIYKDFFREVISNIEKEEKCIVYMLWGHYAKGFKKFITNPKHFYIETNHPSPLSANMGGWFYQNQFIKCNEFLKENNEKEIKWEKRL